MVQTLKRHLKEYASLAARQSGIVLAGDITAKGITFAISLIVMKYVSPDEYIVFGLFMTVLAILTQAADLGLNQTFIRFYALYAGDQPARADAHLHLALRVKAAMVVTLGIAMAIVSPYLASVLKYPALTGGFRLLAAGIIGVGLFEFFQAVFQARQDFKRFTALRITDAVLKIGFIYLFILQSAFSLFRVYEAYAFVPIIMVILVFAITPLLRRRAVYEWRDIGGEMFGFGKWLMITSIATMLMQNLDTLMIAPMLAKLPGEAGIFYAAKKFATPLQVLTISLMTVFFPKAMALRTLEGMRTYVKRVLQVAVPLAVGSVLYLAVLFFAVPKVFPAYTASLPIAAILFAGWIWTMIGNPLTILILSINRADVATKISIVQLFVTIISHYFFIKYLGGPGAALSNVLIWFAAGIFTFTYIYRHRREITTVPVREA